MKHRPLVAQGPATAIDEISRENAVFNGDVLQAGVASLGVTGGPGPYRVFVGHEAGAPDDDPPAVGEYGPAMALMPRMTPLTLTWLIGVAYEGND